MAKVTKNEKRKVSLMTIATFLFAASVMMFIGVIGSAYIGKSYAIESEALPETLTVHADNTWGGDVQNGVGLVLIKSGGENVIYLRSDFYGESNGHRYELYCLERTKGMPNDGTYTKDAGKTSSFTDAGIVYIVTNSYPNSNTFMSDITPLDPSVDVSHYKKVATQFAIWYYQDLANGTPDSSEGVLTVKEKTALKADARYGKAIVDLATKALAAKNAPEAPADALSVDEKSISYRISDDGKYFESSLISVTGSNSMFKSYTVSLDENTYGATIVNDKGAEVGNGAVFGALEKFKIRVPLEKLKDLNSIDLKANITGTFEHKQVFAYKHSTESSQTALVGAFDNLNQNANIELQFNVPTGKVQVSKQDITNSKELPGATLVIHDCNGKEVAKWVSTTEPHYIEALPVTTDTCKYTLTETIAPEGYELSSESIQFEVKDDGSVTAVVMKNTPLTPAPDTGMDIPMSVYIAGGIILICGIAVIYASVKPKKENE